MSGQECFLCSQQAQVQISIDRGIRVYVVSCKRCGEYVLADLVNCCISGLGRDDKACLSIHTRNNSGTRFITLPGRSDEVPQTDAIIARIRGMSAEDRAEEALVKIAERAKRPFVAVPLSSDDEPALYAIDTNDLEGLLGYLSQQGWISAQRAKTGWEVSLTALGEARVREKEKGSLGFKPRR